MAKYTDITLLIDRSGSMSSIKEKMESALREFITQHQSVPSTRLSAITFDTGDPEVILNNVRIGDVKGITIEPRGGTALIDAMCKTIDTLGYRLSAMNQLDRPDQVLFVIISDGEENASRLHTRKEAMARILRQQGTYNWQFVYFGTNQDSIKEAASYGIPMQNALNFSPMFAAEDARFMTKNTVAYASRSGATASFTAEQRTEQEERTKKGLTATP